MKILSTLLEQTIIIKEVAFKVELKKVAKSNVIVKSADKRAGRYVDNYRLSTVAFVNGQSYMTCDDMSAVITELKQGGYKFFTD